jgi:hypothetical protein
VVFLLIEFPLRQQKSLYLLIEGCEGCFYRHGLKWIRLNDLDSKLIAFLAGSNVQ